MKGRPSIYTQELADKICSELSEGISLRTVCKADDMPNKSTIFNWLRTNKDFLDQYARAKEESADAMAEDILDISDDSSGDFTIEQIGEDKVNKRLNNENVQRSRLRVDTRKWLMSKMKPKKYQDKMDVTSDGKAIKGNTITFSNFDEANSKQSIQTTFSE